MAFKTKHLDAWLAEVAAGQRRVSHAVAGQFSASLTLQTGGAVVSSAGGDLGDSSRVALSDSLGLDTDRQIGRGVSTTFYCVTETQLLLGSRSSARNRPTDLLASAPLDAVRVHWFDVDAGAGNSNRHLVVEFGDGTWRGDRSGLTALGRKLKTSNADHFLAALGERAIHAPQG